MKALITFVLFFIGANFCYSQNSVDKTKTNNTKAKSSNNNDAEKIISTQNSNAPQMIEKNGVVIGPNSNLQFNTQDLIDKEETLIINSKDLSVVNPN